MVKQVGEREELEKSLAVGRLVNEPILGHSGEDVRNEDGVEAGGESGMDVRPGTAADRLR